MNNSVNLNYGMNVKNSHLGFYGVKEKAGQKVINTVTKPAAIGGAAVTTGIVLSQLVKHDTKNQKVDSNLAKVPDSVEEMKDRLTFNVPANLKEIGGQIERMENYIEEAKRKIASTKYVEFTGVNTPESKFVVYEPNADGKYSITEEYDHAVGIINRSGKYDLYYDNKGKEIGITRYNSKTNEKDYTLVKIDKYVITKYYNPNGTVKEYAIQDSFNDTRLSFDANGQIESVRMDELIVENKKPKLLTGVLVERNQKESRHANESKWTTDENGITVEFKDGKYMYKGQIDPEKGLVNVVEIGKATPPKTEMSPEKAKILANAGFTEEVIGDLKLESSKYYGPELIDEVLDMVVYLEAKIAQGTPITIELIENTIHKFSPGASGGSASYQKCILAFTWNKGAKVQKVYQK